MIEKQESETDANRLHFLLGALIGAIDNTGSRDAIIEQMRAAISKTNNPEQRRWLADLVSAMDVDMKAGRG